MPLPYKSFINSRDLGSMVNAGGPVIHAVDDGAGPPMIFLHGLGFSLFTFRGNYPCFARSMRVVGVDLPGCGYSRLPGNHGAASECMARYLAAFLDRLGIDRAAVCGAGEGGIYALELALRHPERVSALVLSSPGSLTRHFPKPVRRLLAPVLGDLRIDAMNAGHVRDFLKWCWFNEISVDNYIVRQVYRPFENRMARHVLLRILRAYDDRYVHENLGRIQCPTLVVWGETDAGRPCGIAERYTQAIPGATAQIIRNCGMLPHEEKPQEFNERVEQFLLTALPELEPTAMSGLSDEILDYTPFDGDYE